MPRESKKNFPCASFEFYLLYYSNILQKMNTLQIDVGMYWLNTIFFNTEAWWQSKNINVLNHYQPSVLSHSLKAQSFIFTGIKTYILISYISMNILKAAVISDVDPSLATVVFGFYTLSSSPFIFNERRNQKVLKPLAKAGVYTPVKSDCLFFFFPPPFCYQTAAEN